MQVGKNNIRRAIWLAQDLYSQIHRKRCLHLHRTKYIDKDAYTEMQNTICIEYKQSNIPIDCNETRCKIKMHKIHEIQFIKHNAILSKKGMLMILCKEYKLVG